MFQIPLKYYNNDFKGNTDKNSRPQIYHPNDNISRSISAGHSPAGSECIHFSQGVSFHADLYESRQVDRVILGSSLSFSASLFLEEKKKKLVGL